MMYNLKVPVGWNASLDLLSGTSPTSDEPPFGLAWENLIEDIIFINLDRKKLGIDLGWYPDMSPEGSFVIELLDTTDADTMIATYAKPIRTFQTRSIWEAKHTVECWMDELTDVGS